jgi:hypothetical protein
VQYAETRQAIKNNLKFHCNGCNIVAERFLQRRKERYKGADDYEQSGGYSDAHFQPAGEIRHWLFFLQGV